MSDVATVLWWEAFPATQIDANEHAFLTMGSVGTSQDHHVQVKRAQTMSHCGEK
jgi:hypothetical protein